MVKAVHHLSLFDDDEVFSVKLAEVKRRVLFASNVRKAPGDGMIDAHGDEDLLLVELCHLKRLRVVERRDHEREVGGSFHGELLELFRAPFGDFNLNAGKAAAEDGQNLG